MVRLVSFLYASVVLSTVCASFFMLQKNPIPTKVKEIVNEAESVFPSNTVEVHPFKVGWYNKLVAPEYKLHYDDDSLALIFFTIPYVFDYAFMSFLCEYRYYVIKDSWKRFLGYNMGKVRGKLQDTFNLTIPYEDIMYSFQMESGHAKVLVQTAGHVAGGAYYYQRRDVVPDPWPKNKTIYGVSVHPLYGGYFSLDVVLVLKDIQKSDMKQTPPPDVIRTMEKRKELLTIYNDDWKNPKWREMIPVKRNYTDDHMKYVMTYGKQREFYVLNLIQTHCKNQNEN